MSKLTQTEIKLLADEWAALGRKIEKQNTALGRELEPHITAHNEAVKPILEKYDAKLEKLAARRGEIEETVKEWLTDHGKPVSLEGVDAVAANVLQTGSRRIDPQAFFDRVKERNAAFWECVTIAIQKADRFLGKNAVDELATKETKLVPSLSLKQN
ncbi:MAG: hypothetical protein R2682_01910 [Pyrinomonadaceae bacterium]